MLHKNAANTYNNLKEGRGNKIYDQVLSFKKSQRTNNTIIIIIIIIIISQLR